MAQPIASLVLKAMVTAERAAVTAKKVEEWRKQAMVTARIMELISRPDTAQQKVESLPTSESDM